MQKLTNIITLIKEILQILMTLIVIIGLSIVVLYIEGTKNKKIEEIPQKEKLLSTECTTKDKYLLHLLLQSECNTCPDNVSHLVLCTVYNRSRLQNKSIEDIIFEPNQYVIKAEKHSGRFDSLINSIETDGLADSTIIRFCNKEVFNNSFKIKYEIFGLVFGV